MRARQAEPEQYTECDRPMAKGVWVGEKGGNLEALVVAGREYRGGVGGRFARHEVLRALLMCSGGESV